MASRILVVEDEKIIALDIRNSLQNAGYEVPAIAASGEQALEKIPESRPDLVLMDIILKGDLDGVETAEIIRDRYEIPVVYLTAHADEITLNRAKITDPFGYILKPFEERELITTIEIALSRHKAEFAVKQALKKEKELSDLKSRFVSVVSHEFRNPLSTILFSAELLEKYEERLQGDKKIAYLQRIQLAVQRMSQLLDNVLAISATDAGKLQFQPGPINLPLFIPEVIEEIQFSHASNHEIIFEYQVAEPDQGSVFTLPSLDGKLLRLVLSNLLSNAIKYSPEDKPIYLDVLQQSHAVILQIRDTGIGITEQDQLQLFSLFHRGSNVSNIAGTGLGLSIVKQCVESHQGFIAVTSKVNMGTTFTVTLPSNFSPHYSSTYAKDFSY